MSGPVAGRPDRPEAAAGWADPPRSSAGWGNEPDAANGAAAGGWADKPASEEAWWDAPAAAGPAAVADGSEKVKKSRWGRNKDKDKDKDQGARGVEEPGNEWATEATSRWDRGAPRSDEPRSAPAQAPRGGAAQAPAPRNEAARGEGERIPEQRKRELSAFEDLAPLELNLDEEPKEKTRRFGRRK